MNHKGTWCVIKSGMLCQEGYCSECWIYKKWDKVLEEVDKDKDKRAVVGAGN